ncbi:MAG: OmpA family protein [Clostridiales bacterium]|jgi:outer membrane protein OmpA-like peptidoglycan-associated protein|nr:OmpA family protein [Clostridiales bacterium]
MKEKNPHSVWNHINTTAVALLSLLILSLLLFSAYQDFVEASQGPSTPSNPDEPTIGGPLANKELKEKEEQLKALESNLQKKEEELIQWEKQLTAQDSYTIKLVERRKSIINALKSQFSQSDQPLYVDNQTGTIGFGDGILFQSSESDVTEAGANYLKEFIPAWFSILLNEENRDYISEIIIEGHGDDQGSYSSNLNLSQKRAREVTRYILSEDMSNFQYKDIAVEYITANGKSFSQPIITDGNMDKEKSRRVEFKFRLKDEALIDDIQKIIDERTDS